jgi:ADP-ribosylglycohydrolase
VPTQAAANDDLDLQLVWLKMLQERGLRPTVGDFADYWRKHLGPYPWNEYGFGQRNLDRGLRPPISGCFENYYVDEMGSPIRSEIWACVAPGDPGLAAALAWRDSALDHAGGEGTYGEMFWAGLQSAAFVLSDPLVLLHIGLAMIPIHSAISRAVREAIWCWEHQVAWAEARERILFSFGSSHPCAAPQNHGFTVLGWLYGQDFGDRLCAAVNCGQDTDCTGATLGATLGLVGGTAGIPEEWRAPVGEEIVLHPFTKDLAAPRTVAELTDQTVEVGERLLGERSALAEIGEDTALPEDLLTLLFDNRLAREALLRDPQSTIESAGEYEVALHYGGEPVLRPGIGKTVGVSVRADKAPDQLLEVPVVIAAPDGWEVEPVAPAFGQRRFRLRASRVAPRNAIVATVGLPTGPREFSFTVLGPDEARGWAAKENVERCPVCDGRAGACACRCACEEAEE